MENPVKPENVPAVNQSIHIEVKSDGSVTVDSFTHEMTEGGTEVKKPMNFGQEKKILRAVMDSRQDELVAILCAQFIDNALKQKIQPHGFRSTTVGKFLLGK